MYTVRIWIWFYLLLYVTTLHQLHWSHYFNMHVTECVWSTEFLKEVRAQVVFIQGVDNYIPETTQCVYVILCCSYSVVTIHGMCSASFPC